MDKVDIEKAQRLLDQGMRRGEVAIRMGVTYNVISGMIARKVLKVPEPGKRCYVEYKPMLQRCPITKQEIEEYREILKIGDPVQAEYDGVVRKFKVTEKYRYFCMLQNSRCRTSATYVDLVLKYRGRRNANGTESESI